MMTNRDIDECLVRAELVVTENIQSALEEFYRPDVEREAAMLWADMDPRVKAAVRKKAPMAVKRIEEQIAGG